MEAITIHPKNKEQLEALKVIFKAMKIPFENISNKTEASLVEEDESPYDPEFVKMVKRADEDFNKGKGKSVKLDDIWK